MNQRTDTPLLPWPRSRDNISPQVCLLIPLKPWWWSWVCWIPIPPIRLHAAYHSVRVTHKLLLMKAKVVHSLVIGRGESGKTNFLLFILVTSPACWDLGGGNNSNHSAVICQLSSVPMQVLSPGALTSSIAPAGCCGLRPYGPATPELHAILATLVSEYLGDTCGL